MIILVKFTYQYYMLDVINYFDIYIYIHVCCVWIYVFFFLVSGKIYTYIHIHIFSWGSKHIYEIQMSSFHTCRWKKVSIAIYVIYMVLWCKSRSQRMELSVKKVNGTVWKFGPKHRARDALRNIHILLYMLANLHQVVTNLTQHETVN